MEKHRNTSAFIWPGLLSYSLPIVPNMLGISFEHHDPAEDARACAQVLIQACVKSNTSSFSDLEQIGHFRGGKLFPGGYRGCGVRPVRLSELKAAVEEFDEGHPFFDRTLVFTGTLQSMVRREAAQKVVDVGGLVGSSVGTSTDYLVVGEQDIRKLKDGLMSSKMRKAQSLVSQGQILEVIGERDFLELLGT